MEQLAECSFPIDIGNNRLHNITNNAFTTGEPMTKYGLLSLRTIVGAIDDRALAGFNPIAMGTIFIRSKRKSVISLFTKTPFVINLDPRHFQW